MKGRVANLISSISVPELTFLGAARTVTGSKYLLTHGNARVLFDCGLFQGLKELRERNWQDLPVPATSINAVVLTHAHLDHVGYVPRLVKQGFGGPVFCTAGTAELSRLVLPDSGRIQEEDARQANRHGYSKHSPAMPLYDEADAHRALGHFHPVGFHREIEVADGVTVEFMGSGHLLGFCVHRRAIERRHDNPVRRRPRALRTSGAARPRSMPAMYAPTWCWSSPPMETAIIRPMIRETSSRGSFVKPRRAAGRSSSPPSRSAAWKNCSTGSAGSSASGAFPSCPSTSTAPWPAKPCVIYIQRAHELDPDMRPSGKPGAGDVSAFATARFQVIASPQQSKELTASRKTGIVISSSGMATGGRVLHHLAAALPDPKNTVLVVGFQAEGTRGRQLIEGAHRAAHPRRPVPVRARIAKLNSMSGHADRGEILRWLRTLPAPPRRLMLVHGEPGPMDALKATIKSELGWDAETPQHPADGGAMRTK